MIHTQYQYSISNDEPFDFRAGFYHVDLSNAIHIDEVAESHQIARWMVKELI
jgi:hypothetical protein